MNLYFFRLVLLVSIIILPSFTKYHNLDEEFPAYQLFSKEGKIISFKKMVKELSEADVVLFGELHNNPIAHWLELSVLKSFDKNKVIAGAEMFVTGAQDDIDDYLSSKIDNEIFIKKVELWNNYNTDYRPLLEYTKEHSIPFTATNCERKFARMVAKKGIQSLDTLTSLEKLQLAPLPIEVDFNLPGYKNFLNGDMYGHGGNGKTMAEAQALKDATMAFFINKNWKDGKTFIHFNGAYHCENYEGICWYLKKYNSQLKIKTITTVEQNQLKKLEKENLNKADYIIVVTDDMTKTY